jgi:hypothetical protein
MRESPWTRKTKAKALWYGHAALHGSDANPDSSHHLCYFRKLFHGTYWNEWAIGIEIISFKSTVQSNPHCTDQNDRRRAVLDFGGNLIAGITNTLVPGVIFPYPFIGIEC